MTIFEQIEQARRDLEHMGAVPWPYSAAVASAALLAASTALAHAHNDITRSESALRMENANSHALRARIEDLRSMLEDAQAALADAEKMRELHADLNRRTAIALRKPRFGPMSSWHDIPEIVEALSDMAASRAFAPALQIYDRLPATKAVTIHLTPPAPPLA